MATTKQPKKIIYQIDPHGLCFITTACAFLQQRASTPDLMLTFTHGEMIRKIYDLVFAFCVSKRLC